MLDFFVLLGDSIYADFPSPAVPDHQARTLAEFRRKYAEVYATQKGINNWANLRAATAFFAIFDDHEVLNDFAGGAPAASTRYFEETTGLVNQTKLYLNGLRAFHEYHPIAGEVYGSSPGRTQDRQKFYRYRTFGSDAALFLLDTRSFRDGPLAKPDVTNAEDVARFLEESFTPSRTLLGRSPTARVSCAICRTHKSSALPGNLCFCRIRFKIWIWYRHRIATRDTPPSARRFSALLPRQLSRMLS